MNQSSKILVLGSSGLVGSSIVRRLKGTKYKNILTPSHRELDLIEKTQVEEYIKKNKPDNIFMVAGLVGGIMGNKNANADFLYINSIMILNLLEAIKKYSPKSKLLFTGSTCVYPKENPQPIKENRFLTGPLEETNKGYALAKILGIVGGQLYRQQYGIDVISVMPTNMYGINDNYDLVTGHFIPSLIKKFVDAKKNNLNEIEFWGSGKPRREALYVDDCADACIYLMNNYSSSEIVNIGTGIDYSIEEYVNMMKELIGYKDKIVWDRSKPDGTMLKQTDITRLKSIMPSFSPRSFEEGVKEVLEKDFEYIKIKP
jgi:GDP-L-fucose synthase